MELPNDLSLPFFAYGLFRPGQLGYLRLKKFVCVPVRDCSVSGTLLERDGLPIIDPEGASSVSGDLLIFHDGAALQAYEAVIDLEPRSQYLWNRRDVQMPNGLESAANVLDGRTPRKGSIHAEYENWQAESDPVLTVAVDVAEQILRENQDFDWSLESLFRLEASYLLLWTSIERYASLRYSLSGEAALKKVLRIAGERAYAEALGQVVREPRTIQRADLPRQHLTLNSEMPEESLKYYYQIRSNIIHRGKAAVNDFNRLKMSLEEVLFIFRAVLKRAFEDARSGAN
jgi:hypothetical protein